MKVDPKHLRIVAAIDPAASQTELRGQASRMAISCIGADPDGRIFVLDAWAMRTSTEKFVQRILEVAAQYAPQPFGCEINALQKLFSDTTMMFARAKGIKLHLRPIKQPQKIDKDTRIRLTLQPIVASGRLFLRADQTKLRDEILAFPQTPLKDLIDSLASAINLLPVQVVVQQRDAVETALVAYHRKVGTAPSLLDYRLAQLRGSQRAGAPRHFAPVIHS